VVDLALVDRLVADAEGVAFAFDSAWAALVRRALRWRMTVSRTGIADKGVAAEWGVASAAE
jgi:hypothetical protein